MKKLFALLCTAALAVSLVACGRVKINTVTLPESQLLNRGDSVQLTPTFAAEKETTEEKLAEAAQQLTLEWATSDEAVATVDETGLVTAVGAGEADITVKISESEIAAVCAVTVEVKAEGVAAPEALEFTVGDEGKSLNAKITPEDATNVALQYESSDEKVATVDESGVVTPVAAGECVIKASAVPGAAAASDAGQADEAKAALAAAETNVTVKAAVVKPAPAKKAAAPAPDSTVPAASVAPAAPAPAQPEPAVDSSPSDSGAEQAPDPQPEQPAPAPDSGAETAPDNRENTASNRPDDGEIIEGGGTAEGNGGDSVFLPD